MDSAPLHLFAGVVLEANKGVGASALPSAEDLRSAITRGHGVQVSYVCLLKVGTVPKTRSGKLQRRLITKTCLENGWEPRAVLRKWAATPGKVTGKAETVPKAVLAD